MKLRGEQQDEPEINLTSLIDVVLLLLVFFMVSTSFVNEAELKVRLPQASADPVREETESLEITVSANGEYWVNQRQLVNSRPETLRAALAGVADGQRDIPITIRADAQARHQAVVTAMDVAGSLGFVQINMATMNPDY